MQQSDISVCAAAEHAECPISFEPLYQGRVAVFVGHDGQRVSPHFFKYEAAQQWLNAGGATAMCPMTRRPIAGVKLVPSVFHDSKSWFDICDMDKDGKLSREHTIEALKSQLPLDNAKLDAFLTDDAAWQAWDPDACGFVEFDDIMNLDTGLLAFVRNVFAKNKKEAPVPDIRQDREAWYRRWDEDDCGELHFDEVLRALVKTFKIDTPKVIQLHESLKAVWCVLDDDDCGAISKEDFLKPGEGLADTVIATLSFMDGTPAPRAAARPSVPAPIASQAFQLAPSAPMPHPASRADAPPPFYALPGAHVASAGHALPAAYSAPAGQRPRPTFQRPHRKTPNDPCCPIA